MEKIGLIRQGSMTEHRIFFHATEAGCRAVGLNTLEREKALEGSEQRTGRSEITNEPA
jgi:hypothetical protein